MDYIFMQITYLIIFNLTPSRTFAILLTCLLKGIDHKVALSERLFL